MENSKRKVLVGAAWCVAIAGSYAIYKKLNKDKHVVKADLKLNRDTIQSHISFIADQDKNINIYFGKYLSSDTFAYITELDGNLKLNVLCVKGSSISLSSEELENIPMKFGVVRLKHNDKIRVFYTLESYDGIVTGNVYSYEDRKIKKTSYTKLEEDVTSKDVLYTLTNPKTQGGYLHPYENLAEDYIINNDLMELIDEEA